MARDQLAGINPQYWYFGIGMLLMLVVLFMPKGILGFLTNLVGRREK
jgi:branched-chain amino acid transport system permease protein